MTLDQLIARLEEYRDEFGGDAEVRLMTQQNWPFENEIAGVCSSEEITDAEEDEDDDENDDETEGHEDVIYICEGRQLGYGSGRAWDVAY